LAATIGVLVAFGVPASAGAMTSDHGCKCTTTTPYTTSTTEVTTTTVAAVTTIASTTTHVTTTTLHEQKVTTTTGTPTTPPTSPTSMRLTTTTGPNHNLPFTGGNALFPFLFGLCSLVAGALLLLRRSGSWRASS
jgi:hypothetical protein